MGKFIDLTGFKKDNITVIGDSGERYEQGGVIWLYKCKCGNISKSRSYDIIHTIKSCGCIGVYKDRTIPAKNNLFSQYRNRAKRNNLEFKLSMEEFINLTSQNCYYCGIPPNYIIKSWKEKKYNGNGQYYYNGIDRIDNTKGYILDNCITCCRICNSSKTDREQEEYFNWIKRSYDNLKSKGII